MNACRIISAINVVGGLLLLGVAPLADTWGYAASFAAMGVAYTGIGVIQWREG